MADPIVTKFVQPSVTTLINEAPNLVGETGPEVILNTDQLAQALLNKQEGKPYIPSEKAMKAIPLGLQKKPGGMPPGQFKKFTETYAEHIYQGITPYLDMEGQIKTGGISQSGVRPVKVSPKSIAAEIMRNTVLTVKGYHPAKVPHPMLTHFSNDLFK